MRVIAGTRRSLPLRSVEGEGTRPTLDRYKETLFNILMPYIPGCRFLDLFAGSGAMGLEALSRGAARCTFVESNRQNQKVLAANIGNCGAGEISSIAAKDFEAALADLAGRREKTVFDIVIIDPPYERTEYYVSAMSKLQEYGLIDEGSVAVCEHLYDNKLSDTYGKLVKFREKKYGTIGVDLFSVDNSEPFC